MNRNSQLPRLITNYQIVTIIFSGVLSSWWNKPGHLAVWDEVWGLEMSERTGVVAVVSDVGTGFWVIFFGPFDPPDIPRNWQKY